MIVRILTYHTQTEKEVGYVRELSAYPQNLFILGNIMLNMWFISMIMCFLGIKLVPGREMIKTREARPNYKKERKKKQADMRLLMAAAVKTVTEGAPLFYLGSEIKVKNGLKKKWRKTGMLNTTCLTDVKKSSLWDKH